MGGKSWHEATDYCRGLSIPNEFKYDLVSLQSEDEYNFILYYEWSDIYNEWGHTFHIWTGLNDLDKEGEWRWSDGSILQYAKPKAIWTSPWRPGEPLDTGVSTGN